MDIDKISRQYRYCPESGLIFRLHKIGRWKAGEKIGWLSSDGYIKVKLFGVFEYAHRIAWALHYGVEPEKNIDHINRVRSDNRIENLRMADFSQNSANQSFRSDNTSGFKGVTWNQRRGKWQAQIQYRGHRRSGLFDCAEEAADFYNRNAKLMCDEYFHRNPSA